MLSLPSALLLEWLIALPRNLKRIASVQWNTQPPYFLLAWIITDNIMTLHGIRQLLLYINDNHCTYCIISDFVKSNKGDYNETIYNTVYTGMRTATVYKASQVGYPPQKYSTDEKFVTLRKRIAV